MMLYAVYIVLIYLMFDNMKVFSSAEKSFKGMDPMVVKVVLIGGGVYLLDMVIKKNIIEGFPGEAKAREIYNDLEKQLKDLIGV